MSSKLIYYVYAYLRSKDSDTAKAGTPYYIGKGCCYRANHNAHATKPPTDKSLVVFLERNLTELGAFALERRMIRWFGRKDLNTGILRNLTDGGEGPSGYKHTEEWKKNKSIQMTGHVTSNKTIAKMSKSLTGRKLTDEHVANIKANRAISEDGLRRCRLALLGNTWNRGRKLSEETIAKRKATIALKKLGPFGPS